MEYQTVGRLRLLPQSRYVTAQLEHLGAPAEKVINYIEGKEAKGMLAATIIELVEAREKSERKERKAKREGIKEGKEKGIQKGESKFLMKLLKKRFGNVPEWAQEKLKEAKPQKLESWGLKVLDAQTLEETLQ